MRVTQLNVYPIKATRGTSVADIPVERRGLSGDRRWMIVDQQGRFVSQRELPALARLHASIVETGLDLSIDGERLSVRYPAANAPRSEFGLWRDTLRLPEASEATAWLSARLGQPVRLVYQPDDTIRPVSLEWGAPGDETNLGDAYPILVVTTAAFAALQRAALSPIEMERFRPNIVVEGAVGCEDDGWKMIRIGEVVLDFVKPCPRCTVTTVDQTRGVVTGDEPLTALRRTRMSGDPRVAGLLFGWNAVPRQLGRVHVGDDVEVLSRRADWPIRAVKAAAAGAETATQRRNEWTVPSRDITPT